MTNRNSALGGKEARPSSVHWCVFSRLCSNEVHFVAGYSCWLLMLKCELPSLCLTLLLLNWIHLSNFWYDLLYPIISPVNQLTEQFTQMEASGWAAGQGLISVTIPYENQIQFGEAKYQGSPCLTMFLCFSVAVPQVGVGQLVRHLPLKILNASGKQISLPPSLNIRLLQFLAHNTISR